jgi:hypothetical protein
VLVQMQDIQLMILTNYLGADVEDNMIYQKILLTLTTGYTNLFMAS